MGGVFGILSKLQPKALKDTAKPYGMKLLRGVSEDILENG